MLKKHVIWLSAGTALIAVAAPAIAQNSEAPTGPVAAQSAQDAPASQAGAPGAPVIDDGGLGEIVVTAQKVASSEQKTPIALRVVSGADLAKAGVTDVSGLQRLAPDLGITTDTIFTKLALRGVTAESVAEGADAALTVNIDGEYINRLTALNASFYDLDRIEVLKGPQGTLYGRNSTAGAINIITKKPTDKFEGFVQGSYGNYDAKTIQGAVNIPLADGLGVRIAGLHNDHKGFRNNDVDGGTGGRNDDANVDSVRGTIGYNKDRIRAYLQGEYTNINQSAPAQYGVPLSVSSPGVVQVPLPDGGYDYLPLNTTFSDLPKHAFPLGSKGNFKVRQYHIRGEFDYDLTDQLTLSYVGGYFHNNVSSLLPLNGFLPSTFSNNDAKENSRDWSNELRLSYHGDSGLFIQGGLFYFRETQDVAAGLFLPIAGGAYINQFYRPDFKLQSYAAFAQADLPVTDTIKLTGGVRYTSDKKRATYYNWSGFGAPPTIDEIRANAGATPGACEGTNNAQYNILNQCYGPKGKISWMGGIEYSPTTRNLLYAKVSSGYRSGGFDNLTSQTINGLSVGNFAPETIVSYEVGAKNRFLDNTLQLNLSAFHYDYKDLQIDNFINAVIGHATVNAGKARYNGVEADMIAALSRNDRFTVTFNYLDAKLTKYVAFQTGFNGGVPERDISGNRPSQAPKYTVAVGYDHTFDLGSAGELVASAYSRFKSDYYLTSYNNAGDMQKAFTQTDLSLTYSLPGDRYSLQAYVHNVENYVPLNYAAFTGGSGINIYNFIFGAPRTYGVQATVKF